MKKKLLLSDNIHFKPRKNNKIFEWLNKNLSIVSLDIPKLNYDSFGDYVEFENFLKLKYEFIFLLDLEKIKNAKYKEINLYNICKREYTQNIIIKENGININKFNYQIIPEQHKNDLLLNLAAGCYWIDYWSDQVKKINKNDFFYVFLFSGSLIYQSSLYELVKNMTCRVGVTENLFHKNYYIIEKNISSTPNNSIIKNVNLKKYDDIDYDKKIIFFKKFWKSFINLNVKQPKKKEEPISFHNSKENILILGQVINDFSLVQDNKVIHPHYYYKELINYLLLNTSYNIIFKIHPWERVKTKTNSTLRFLETFNNERMVVVENYNLNQLFNLSDCVITINSQSAIEATYKGFKTICLDKSLLGEREFVYNVNINNLKNELTDLFNNFDFNLNINEYKSFVTYIYSIKDLLIDVTIPSNLKKNFFYEVNVDVKINNFLKPSFKTIRKINKLKNNPYLFFKDAFRNILKNSFLI